MKLNSVSYIYFNHLPGADAFLDSEGTFNSFSYGDAALTLVTPVQLLHEVTKDEFPELYKSLWDLPGDTLIGFDS